MRTDQALGYVTITAVDTFSTPAIAKDGAEEALPADLPKGLTLRKLDDGVDFTLTVALPAPGTAPADALLAALARAARGGGARAWSSSTPGAEADLRLAVIADSPRPDAIWVLPATGLAEDLATTPSVSTADKDGAALAIDAGRHADHDGPRAEPDEAGRCDGRRWRAGCRGGDADPHADATAR